MGNLLALLVKLNRADDVPQLLPGVGGDKIKGIPKHCQVSEGVWRSDTHTGRIRTPKALTAN